MAKESSATQVLIFPGSRASQQVERKRLEIANFWHSIDRDFYLLPKRKLLPSCRRQPRSQSIHPILEGFFPLTGVVKKTYCHLQTNVEIKSHIFFVWGKHRGLNQLFQSSQSQYLRRHRIARIDKIKFYPSQLLIFAIFNSAPSTPERATPTRLTRIPAATKTRTPPLLPGS